MRSTATIVKALRLLLQTLSALRRVHQYGKRDGTDYGMYNTSGEIATPNTISNTISTDPGAIVNIGFGHNQRSAEPTSSMPEPLDAASRP